MAYPGLDGHPRRIVPTPVSIPITPNPTPAEVYQSFRERDARMEQEIQQRAAQMKAEKEKRIETQSVDKVGMEPEKSVKNQKTSERNTGGANDDDKRQQFGQATSHYSGTSRSTIGDTTIATAEASMIRREVRDAL